MNWGSSFQLRTASAQRCSWNLWPGRPFSKPEDEHDWHDLVDSPAGLSPMDSTVHPKQTIHSKKGLRNRETWVLIFVLGGSTRQLDWTKGISLPWASWIVGVFHDTTLFAVHVFDPGDQQNWISASKQKHVIALEP